ncbi:MAG: flagellar assembly protein FliW [Sulfurimonas sp.]|nr:flagellar assembly protein FliW [Sulfurimonas sp.]
MKFDVCLPILGFEDIKQVSLEKIDDVFMKMQSLGNEYISFTMINPFTLREYDFEIPDNAQNLLEIDKNSNLIILNIVLIQTPIEDSIVNFIGPMVFNTDNSKAVQVILNDSPQYSVAEKISTFLNK